MPSRPFLDSISGWARRACGRADPEPAPPLADDPHLYALGAWPDLPEGRRTAAIYRLLSVMTVQPVPRQWMARKSGLDPAAIDALLQWLDGAGVLVRSARCNLAGGMAAPQARQPASGELLALV